jgi:alkylation response protein AidB-like acyl-CoA dehydrogenase
MKFELSEEQHLIRDSLRNFLADVMPLDRIRLVAADRKGFDPALWEGLCDLGIAGLLVAEKFGGAGLGLLDAVVVAEELGRAAAPAPFLSASVMAPLAISAAADQEQQSKWLPRIAAGEMRVAIAFGAVSGVTGITRVERKGLTLSGRAEGLLDCGGASHALVFAADGKAAMVALDSRGVVLTPRPTLDRTRPLADLDLDNVVFEPLLHHGDSLAVAHRVLDAGRLMLAADILGAGQRMIDKAVEYAGQRIQFGRVIASYQAVKHMCAEMVTDLEPARSLLWYAAYIQGEDGETDEQRRALACLAKAHFADVGRDIARISTEVHGGMGFTDLMGLHYWFKRISFDRQVLGGSERCREEAARVQGWFNVTR